MTLDQPKLEHFLKGLNQVGFHNPVMAARRVIGHVLGNATVPESTRRRPTAQKPPEFVCVRQWKGSSLHT